MKSHQVKLTKNEAIGIAYQALMERITDRPGIWTYLNGRVRRARLVTVPAAGENLRARAVSQAS